MENLLIVFFFSCFTGTFVMALDCFKCVSVDGSNKACEEPFHNNYTSSILESPCMGGRKGRNGVFPATACLKLAGVYDDTGESMVVRGCGLDSGTLTVDTEIVRMSHCGGFYFDDRYVSGCLQSCVEDGCNGAIRGPLHTQQKHQFLAFFCAVFTLFFILYNRDSVVQLF